MELVSEAIAFAVKAHDGMRRKKSNAPYILHPMEAAVIVGTMTDDQNLIAAAALHDVVEDTIMTDEEIKELEKVEVAPEEKQPKVFFFPNEWVKIEADSYEEALNILHSNKE